MTVFGTVEDTILHRPLEHSSIMAIRISDSLLVKYTHSDKSGCFKLEKMPLDTYQVVISHPRFGDRVSFVLGNKQNTIVDFKKVILPQKNISMKEVVIYAYKDPVYYKGDTLVFVADSFKVKQNATIEDLLKKLPGLKVEKDGQIKSQGKNIDKVLVDGDEFFGSDFTIATRNMEAQTLETVEIYEKKNEDADSKNETIKVLDLKLKEDAKVGYFGKSSTAKATSRFYEGEVLANFFKYKRKVSLFGLGTNTPKSTIGGNDKGEFGIDDGEDFLQKSDGDQASPPWGGGPGVTYNSGMPQVLKSGIYYSDHIARLTKLTINYTYTKAKTNILTQVKSQYFLSDTTYTSDNSINANNSNEANNLNFLINHQLDSLTNIELSSGLRKNLANDFKSEVVGYAGSTRVLARKTSFNNINNGDNLDWASSIKIKRNFAKKGRDLNIVYNYNQSDFKSSGLLNTRNEFYSNVNSVFDAIDQSKTSKRSISLHSANLIYTEPISPNVKMEYSYFYRLNNGTQNKRTSDFDGNAYSLENLFLTNNFESVRHTNRVGANFIYDDKKHLVTIGTKLRRITMNNVNLMSNKELNIVTNNVLPVFRYHYKINDYNTAVGFNYETSSEQPDINQLQPVYDNRNPNQVQLGNPDLKPTFQQFYDLWYHTFKPISGNYLWTGIKFTPVNGAFGNSISYDEIGRTVIRPINVNGNYTSEAYFGETFELLSKKLVVSPEFNLKYNRFKNNVNGQQNITNTFMADSKIGVDFYFEKLMIGNWFKHQYIRPVSSLNAQSIQPYISATYNFYFYLDLPKKIKVNTDTYYNINSNRAAGYNKNYLLLNFTISKAFFAKENLIFSLEGYDLLNQNTSIQRIVQDNVVSDIRSNIIGRVIAFRLTYKINSKLTKDGPN